MAFTVDDFLAVMEELAPAALAEVWDSTGLQAGSRQTGVDAVLVALNITDAVIDEALAESCQLILVHHPLIFAPLDSLSDDDPSARLALRAVREGLAVFVAHTNLDAAPGGLADQLAEIIGMARVRPLMPAATGQSKLVAFVPEADLDRVRAALYRAGGGRIGDYEHCSWATSGTGTFRPREGAAPAVGEVGRDETVAELRLEMVFPANRTAALSAALMEAHPYEEPAFDIYPLQTPRRRAGQGRIGDLDESVELDSLAGELAELFGLPGARYAGPPNLVVRRLAVAPGSGAGLIDACADADALVGGDFRYHHTLTAPAGGLALIDIPHQVSESLALRHWATLLAAALKDRGVRVIDSQADTDFWRQAAPRRKEAILAAEENEMVSLHVDGGARGNPGPAGIGAVLTAPGGDVIETLASFIGNATNNVAEYQALIAGVEMALDRDVDRLAIFSDSELIVRQLQGSYKVKNEGLKPYYEQARAALARLQEYELNSIPREANTLADSLVNRALDEAGR